MKLVVFAHMPPPMHGQSYMVELMLEGLRVNASADAADSLQLFHVNAKLSRSTQEVGKFRWSKIFRLLTYCLQAWWHRFAHGASSFYYIPAPAKRSALYRDWIVMAICRPVFRRIIFHWHGIGLGEWLHEEAKPWERWITHALLDKADLSIVLSEFACADAKCFLPKKVAVIPNGIPDPCPDFDSAILPERHKRFEKRQSGQSATFTVLFLGTCSEAKGLFATLEAIALVNRQFEKGESRLVASLLVGGEFLSEEDRRWFSGRITGNDLANAVDYVGFADTDEKYSLFRRSDCLCFPSLYHAEGQPVTIIEALAFGLPVIATRWRGIPELLAHADGGIISDQSVSAIAEAIASIAQSPVRRASRDAFLSNYRVEQFVSHFRKAFSEILSERTS